MDNNIFDLYAKRHSFYNITNDCPLTAKEIENLVQKSLELYPSPFNSQSARVMVLFGKNHKNLWGITQTELLKAAPKEKAQAISDKIASFVNGHGTILYFTDTAVTQALQNKFPLYAANFDNWAYQCNAILQFMVWTALANSDIGANLQHYNPCLLYTSPSPRDSLLMMLFVKLLTYQTIGNLLPKCLLAALAQLLKHTVLKI